MKPQDEAKIIIVVIDGMSDDPISGNLDKETPLDVARTPNLDRVAREGMIGYVHSIGFWEIGGSDTSHVALLGYDPWTTYTGRGPIEVAGTGVDLQPGDVSIRCNYCTVDGENLVLIERTAGYIREGVEELAKAVNENVTLSDPDVKFEFRNSQDYRCVVYFRGPGISPNITDMDPSYDIIIKDPVLAESLKENPRIVPCQPRDGSIEAKHMADLLTEWVRKVYHVLDNHPVNVTRRKDGKPPANCIMPRGAGATPVYEPFLQRWGLWGACVAGTGLIKGIGKLLGMSIPDVPGATGYIDSDLVAKARVALECLDTGHDFVLIHVEGSDEVSHDKDVKQKINMLEKADAMLGYIMDKARGNLVICVLSDHSTSCVKGDHTAEPSPIGIWGNFPLLKQDGIPNFSERTACLGSIGSIEGKDLIPMLLKVVGVPVRQELKG